MFERRGAVQIKLSSARFPRIVAQTEKGVSQTPYERDDQSQPGFEKTQLQPLRAAPMQLRLFMIGKVAAPKGGSNTTLAFNWAGDRSVEYASHPRVPRRITWDL